MSTFTHSENITGGVLSYANNEVAFLGDDMVYSMPAHSTAISYWSYMPATKKLTVQYRSSDTYYTYEGVPFSTMFAMMGADSLGAFVAKQIKPNFSVA